MCEIVSILILYWNKLMCSHIWNVNFHMKRKMT